MAKEMMVTSISFYVSTFTRVLSVRNKSEEYCHVAKKNVEQVVNSLRKQWTKFRKIHEEIM